MRHVRPWLPIAALGLAVPLSTAPLGAQAPAAAAVAKAAATITKEDVARRIGIVADDSMMGRDTPSPGLEKTAQYVADQFKKFGLKPGGENGSWFQRYPAGRKLDFAKSHIVFTGGGKDAAAAFTSTARLAIPYLPDQLGSTGTVLFAGRHTAASAKRADVRGKVVIYVAPAGIDSTLRQQVLRTLFAASKGLIILADPDSAYFAKRLQAALQRPAVQTNEQWAAYVWPAAVQAALTAGGLDLAQARADTAPVVQPLPQLTVRLDATTQAVLAPNTVGILEGSDPTLKSQYIVVSGHMDHIGISSGQTPDSINNGADDDGSGSMGVVELAEAFSQPGARPKRSMIFLTVSGEEKGLWGSSYFTDHPPVPIGQIVADLNIDMIGRNWKDTIVAIGKEHSDLGATLNRVAAAHPELHMTPIDDIWPQEQFYYRSDHYNFAKHGVPILFFFSGTHEDYHQVSDSPDKIDSEKEARILRLIYYLGQEIGNAAEKPKWDPDSYKKIVKQP